MHDMRVQRKPGLRDMRQPLQYARLVHHRILRVERFSQKFLACAQQEGQWILYIQPEEQGLTSFLRHVSKAPSYGPQVLDKNDGDACNMLLFKVQQM